MRFKLWKTMAMTLAFVSFAVTGSLAAVTQVEGQAGGGIVPWALLSGGQPTASFTWVNSGDYTLSTLAAQVNIAKWVELSYARQTFDTGDAGLALADAGIDMRQINVDVLGAKVKLLDMGDGPQPALAVGVQYKRTDADDNFLNLVGADDTGFDYYLAATKVIPVAGKNLLLNGTVRGTKANQIGILGFGSSTDDSYSAQFEGTIGLFLNDQTVLGVEYRTKPDNIDGLAEDDWGDIFFAYFPNPNLSLVIAYAQLGDIAPGAGDVVNAVAGAGTTSFATCNYGQDQRGLYLQIQANF